MKPNPEFRDCINLKAFRNYPLPKVAGGRADEQIAFA